VIVTAAAFFGELGYQMQLVLGAIALIVLLLALVTALSLGLAFACLVTLN